MDDLKDTSSYHLQKELENLKLYLDRAESETKGNKKLEESFFPDIDYRRARINAIKKELYSRKFVSE